MTPARFRAALASLDFTIGEAAAHFKANRRTVQRWCRGRQDIPPEVVEELKRLLRDEAQRLARLGRPD